MDISNDNNKNKDQQIPIEITHLHRIIDLFLLNYKVTIENKEGKDGNPLW